MCSIPNFVVPFSLSFHYESFTFSCCKLPTPSPSNKLLSCSFLVLTIFVSTFSWTLHSITFQHFVFLFLCYFSNYYFNNFMNTAFHHLLVASFIVSCTFSFTIVTITSLVTIISSRCHHLLVTSSNNFMSYFCNFIATAFHCLPKMLLLGTNSFTFQELFSSLVSSSNTIFSLSWHLLQNKISYNNFFIFSKLSIVRVASYWNCLL